ncbi:MAG: class I tRNA ligase family protein [Bacteroides stercoris]
MEKKFKRTTVTSALPYANGPVHIGHLAGVYVPADIYVRYLRLKKEDVVFIGGSDEHGVPITIRAKKEGITPQDVVDRYHTLIKKSFEEFGISFDVYSRTTSKTHHDTASEFFRKLYDKGEFIEKDQHAILRRGSQDFPCRPLHHRRVSALPRRGRLRRPMREMRYKPQPYRPD